MRDVSAGVTFCMDYGRHTHLPAAGAAVTRAWRGTATAWNASAAEDLLTEVHRIAGVAPMFGFAAVGQAAIYTKHFHHVSVMRKVLLRMASWMNYVFPFH